jgi:molecular chaperone GrpE
MTSFDPSSGPSAESGRGAESGGRPADPGTESDERPAFGGQRPTDSAARPAGDDSPEARPEERAGEGAAPEESDSFPPEAGLSADRVTDSPLAPEDEVARERDEYKEALIRLQADFENYKKRMLKQQTEYLERAAATLVEKLLPVLDTADLALAHGSGEDVKQVTAALTSALEREGLDRIDASGGAFDPTLHDAVAHEAGDGEQEVAEVLRAGYRWKGRVIRPAMVKVRG